MPTLFCCILNCETESVSSKKRKIFYRLPQNIERKQLWLNQIGDRIKYGTISPNSRICNAHFATGKPNLDSSHIDYIPTLFPWSTKDDMSKSHQAVENYEMKIKELEQKILAKAFLTASNESRISPETEVSKLEADDYSKLNIEVDSDQKSKIQKINTQSESTIAHLQSIVSHPNISMANRSSSTDLGNTVTLNSNILNYLINSLTHVNVSNNTSTVSTVPLSVNIAMPTCPLNLSQSYNKTEDQNIVEVNKSINTSSLMSVKPGTEFFKPVNQNGQMFSFQIQNVISLNSNPAVASTAPPVPSDETNNRSCTCTKSSCLKLYCECFATGNICSSGCTCINCRNNNHHKEERAKIVSSYLERDPWVFNSKIDSQEVGKKHSKGCNCLKSSCLKNYCECFENKVFCSKLCRCRLCCNNEEHAHQKNKSEEVKIYPASHTSDSLSVLSENSPRDLGRKRKSNATKSNEVYEDVSSNESSEELSVKRQQLDCDTTPMDTDRLSAGGRSITSMDIPPVLPQEDDFTEEELALMVKFREQRSVKIESVSPPPASPLARSTPVHFMNGTLPHYQLDPNMFMSRAVASLVSGGGCHPSEVGKLSGQDLLQLLVGQQLMVPRVSGPLAPPPLPTMQGLSLPSTMMVGGSENSAIGGGGSGGGGPGYGHVIPATLSAPPFVSSNGLGGPVQRGPPGHPVVVVPQPLAQVAPIVAQVPPPPPAPVVAASASASSSSSSVLGQHTQALQLALAAQTHTITACHNPCSIVSNYSPIKNKLSTEDYVRRHIEAAERAVRADNMRRDCPGPKKALVKQQKIKIEPVVARTSCSMSGGSGHRLSCNGDGSSMTVATASTGDLSGSSGDSGGPQTVQSRTSAPPSPMSLSPTTTAMTSSLVCQARQMPPGTEHSVHNGPLTDTGKWKARYRTLRTSLQHMRTELRSIKVHMRADQSKIRRLEAALVQMTNDLYNRDY